MKSSSMILAVAGVGLLVIASQFAQGQPAAEPVPKSILSKLQVGKLVRFGLGNEIPLRIGLVSDMEIEALKGKDAAGAKPGAASVHPIYTITEVGSDYFVAQNDNGKSTREITIPLHSIGTISRQLDPVAK